MPLIFDYVTFIFQHILEFLGVSFSNFKKTGISSLSQSPQPTQNLCVYSEFLSFFVLCSRLLADFLSHLGKWVKLIKFEAENELFLHLEG